MVRAEFGSRLICPRAQTCMDSKVVRTEFGSGLICLRAQTCMDSKVVRTEFGSGLICPKGSNMLRAEIQRALRRAPRQLRGLRLGLQTRRSSNHSAAHVGESNSRSNVFQISRTSVCVSSRCLHSLLLEMGNQCRNTTRVAHFISSTLQCLRESACGSSR